MRYLGTALLTLGLLLGCSQAPAPTAVEAAQNTPSAPARPQHNFRLYGNPDKGEFMLDTLTGDVWQLHSGSFVKVSVKDADGGAKPNCGEMVYNQKTGKLENPKGCSN